jgi:hypothetical protein
MITNSPFIQLFMVILAGAILILYIQPTVESFRLTEDRIVLYKTELDRVKDVTMLLNKHIADIETLSLASKEALEIYLPATVDEISVMRDLQTVVEGLDLELISLEYTGGAQVSDSDTAESTESGTGIYPGLTPVSFNLSINATYEEVKDFLRALEINRYQIYITEAALTPSDDGEVALTLALQTFALNPNVALDTPDTSDVVIE